MKVYLMPNMTRKNTIAVTKKICDELLGNGIEFAGAEELKEILPPEICPEAVSFEESSADIIISVGGDGSVIRAVKTACMSGVGVLGVNAGNLAYLCELDDVELEHLSKLKTGDYSIQKRMMLEAVVTLDGKELFRESGINDIVFRRDADANLISLNVLANGKRIANYTADGVIFATPTGSSAYSLSAGGAIIEPTLDATLVTPICSHSLIIRPYVFRADTVFTVSPAPENVHTVISVDGNEPFRLPEGCVVTVAKSQLTADFVSLKSNLFIDVLNKKLG